MISKRFSSDNTKGVFCSFSSSKKAGANPNNAAACSFGVPGKGVVSVAVGTSSSTALDVPTTGVDTDSR